MTAEILLSQGQTALVDDADYLLLSQWKWTAGRSRDNWYAFRRKIVGRRRYYIPMHRVVLGLSLGRVPLVDHINGIGTDNRRCNLRLCTNQQNTWNSRARSGSSRFKGVSWKEEENRWRARIRRDGMERSSYHREEVAAALAYDQMAREWFGDYAFLNFPEITTYPPRRGPRVHTSAFRGVSWVGSRRLWRVYLCDRRRVRFIGSFDDELAAALAYDSAARRLFGAAAQLNFPTSHLPGEVGL